MLLHTLESGNGMTVAITDYGARIQSLWVPDRHGEPANVALGLATLSDYVDDTESFGAIVGRYANRIAGAAFALGGETFRLPANDGPHTLHGGPGAWSAQVWDAAPEESSPQTAALALTYTDPAGRNGFPGEVSATVRYTLAAENALRIDYTATTNSPTVINLTNHTYFNLAGEGSGDVYDQVVRINAERFVAVDAAAIPTGEFVPVAGTPFDFREPKPIGRDLRRADAHYGEQLAMSRGYDHTWVLGGEGLRLAAVAEDPVSGRVLRVHTTEPGVQFYTGNFLVGDVVGSGGRTYRQGDAFALETQHYPDTPHHLEEPGWPSVVLEPGMCLQSTTVFEFAVA